MRITHLTLPCRNVEQSRAFYANLLVGPAQGNIFHAGDTSIELVQTDVHGSAHLAFNVPYDEFDASCAWLDERTGRIATHDGSREFGLGAPWNSRSAYFWGPNREVLEFIARRDLAVTEPAKGPFGPGHILSLSEVGLPSEDPQSAPRALQAAFGVAPFGATNDGFCPLGSHDGLFIVVDRMRQWAPETGQLPGTVPLHVVVESGSRSGVVEDPNGWRVVAAQPRQLRRP